MSGFEADLAAAAASARLLRSTADSVSSAAERLDGNTCARLGPGRLPALAAGLIEDTKRDLDSALAVLGEHAELVDSVLGQYAELDSSAAELLRRTAGGADGG